MQIPTRSKSYSNSKVNLKTAIKLEVDNETTVDHELTIFADRDS